VHVELHDVHVAGCVHRFVVDIIERQFVRVLVLDCVECDRHRGAHIGDPR